MINSKTNLSCPSIEEKTVEKVDDTCLDTLLASSACSSDVRGVRWTEALALLKDGWSRLVQLTEHPAFKSDPVVTFSGLREIFEKLTTVSKSFFKALDLLKPFLKDVSSFVDEEVGGGGGDGDEYSKVENVSSYFKYFEKDESHFLGKYRCFPHENMCF